MCASNKKFQALHCADLRTTISITNQSMDTDQNLITA